MTPSHSGPPHPEAMTAAPALSKAGQRARGVFLHSGWRTAGTWAWSRFRTLPQVMAFYEPLHGVLAKDGKTLMSVRADGWHSRHPRLSEPYFSEFLPLMAEGRGLPLFDPAFDADRFNLSPGEDLPGLRAYLESLLAASERRGKVAVLKFCRSMGRLRWMVRAFPDAAHVVVIRNPAAQWASAWGQMDRHGNPWFVAAPYRVLGANLHVDRVRRIMEALECDEPAFHAMSSLGEVEGGERVGTAPLGLSYRVALAHWILNALSVSGEVSAIVDSDLMGLSHRYGRQCAEQLHKVTGLRPDFSDAQPASISSEPRSPKAWMGLDAESVIGWHLAADAFVQSEIGADASERLALSVIRSKLVLANQQAMLGGLAFQASGLEAEDQARYCADLLSLESLLQDAPPSEEPPWEGPAPGASLSQEEWGFTRWLRGLTG